MTDVEKVARAICKSRTGDGWRCCQWPSQGGRTNCTAKTGAYDDGARAALAAMAGEARARHAASFTGNASSAGGTWRAVAWRSKAYGGQMGHDLTDAGLTATEWARAGRKVQPLYDHPPAARADRDAVVEALQEARDEVLYWFPHCGPDTPLQDQNPAGPSRVVAKLDAAIRISGGRSQ